MTGTQLQALEGGEGTSPPADGVTPAPVLPAFGDRGPVLSELVAALAPPPGGGEAPRPDWVPPGLPAAPRRVLLVLDGLGWRQLGERTTVAPMLAGGRGGPVTSVAPSTTAVALTSLSTGLPPAEHGVVGYRLRVDGEIMNVLRWTVEGRDARRRLPPKRFQPHPALTQAAGPVTVVTRAELTGTGFSAAHLEPARLRGWSTPSGLAVEVRRALDEGAAFVYAYYDGIDRVAHRHGLGEHYDAELRMVDRLVADLFEGLPSDVALAVTADHGQVDVGPRSVVLDGALMTAVTELSGEGRFRWLHVRPGALDDTLDAAAELYGDVAWVRSVDDLIDEGWLGGRPGDVVRSRLGHVALVPFEPLAFLDPADTGEQRLAARHGSLTEDEMLVPLLGWWH